uniref:4.1m domain-containing protein n=1 Tax=Caenorhabditis tropicalis TaxID=1561998 RepID=A0A1I7TAS1_9PELO
MVFQEKMSIHSCCTAKADVRYSRLLMDLEIPLSNLWEVKLESKENFCISLSSFTALLSSLLFFALVALVVLFFIKRNAETKKRESEKSKLLRNPANNSANDTPVEIVYDDPPENPS